MNQLDDITESCYSPEEEILSVSLDHTATSVDMSKLKTKIFAHMEIANELVKMQAIQELPAKFVPQDTEIKMTNLKLTRYSKIGI